MSIRASVVLFAVAAAALAGCVGGGPGGGKSNPNVGPLHLDIDGAVTDTEARPLEGVQLGLRGTDHTTSTDSSGHFGFGDLAPGTYTLDAAKLDFNPTAREVEVKEGHTTVVDLQLEHLRVFGAYKFIDQFRGFITCSVGTEVLLSEECGQGLQTPVGNYGRDPNNNIDWKFNLTDFDHLAVVYLELHWTPVSAAAHQLGFNVAHNFTCTPDCAGDPTYCDVFKNYGESPQHCSLTAKQLDVKDPTKPFAITGRAWAAPSKLTEGSNVVTQQAFMMYRTDFHGMNPPAGYSAASS